jgi:hypothetical protein
MKPTSRFFSSTLAGRQACLPDGRHAGRGATPGLRQLCIRAQEPEFRSNDVKARRLAVDDGPGLSPASAVMAPLAGRFNYSQLKNMPVRSRWPSAPPFMLCFWLPQFRGGHAQERHGRRVGQRQAAPSLHTGGAASVRAQDPGAVHCGTAPTAGIPGEPPCRSFEVVANYLMHPAWPPCPPGLRGGLQQRACFIPNTCNRTAGFRALVQPPLRC